MGLIVQKYGGSSLATPELIRHVAQNVIRTRNQGHKLVVVVSAMGKMTDELVELAHQVSRHPSRREMDMLLSVGERMSISLLAMAIQDLGAEAISFTGSQVGIITDDKHTNARILEVKALRIPQALEEGKIVIVAGFQGVSINKEITTLGRGGSDATAVALAAALGADECQILKDVDGVFLADPRRIPQVKINPRLGYDEMIELAELGAGVINQYAVEIARHYHVKIAVGNTFTNKIGTIITDRSLDTASVSGLVVNDSVLGIKFADDSKENLWKAQDLLEKERWKIYYSYLSDSTLWVILDRDSAEHALKVVGNSDLSYRVFEDIVLLSIVGSGLNYNTPLVKDVLLLLDEWKKEILSLQATIQKISVILHKSVDLEKIQRSIYNHIEEKGLTVS